jgi:diguanylate cyclase (GGDEF)-like protein
MIKDAKQTVPFVQRQLEDAIEQLKLGNKQENVLVKLEAVLAQMQTLVTHDHLTGALNKETFIAQLEQELLRSHRTGHTFTLAIIIVDDLPELMEIHGQEIIKKILKITTEQAQLVLRGLDTFGRMDGARFGILMPTTWVDQSLIAIQRLKNKMCEVEWDSIVPGLKITISTGITSNAHNDTSELIVQRATKALVNAKKLGNDKVEQIEQELPGYDPSA